MDDDTIIPDERLSLIFTCCHPALSPDAQVALTLRLVGGLTTGEIARAFLVAGGDARAAASCARRRRSARRASPTACRPTISCRSGSESALAVVYLIFNEGYSATSGEELMRPDLMAEAIRLGGILAALMPDEAEVLGLEALLLLQASRTRARSGRRRRARAAGRAGPLALGSRPDRRGVALLDRALSLRRPGPYQLQAAIAALHAQAR